MEVDDEAYQFNISDGYNYENENCITISSNDTSLIYKKKYIDGEWVDALPSESGLPQDVELIHKVGSDDKFLSDAIGELATLTTTNKTSLVAAKANIAFVSHSIFCSAIKPISYQ